MIKLSKTVFAFLIFGYAFLYIPLVFIVVCSFSESEVPGIWTKFSLKWFALVFQDKDLLKAAATSIEIAGMSATGATIMGILAASATTSCDEYLGRKCLKKLMIAPIILPELVIGFSLLMLFILSENIFGFPKGRGIMTVTIGHTMGSVAYVYKNIRSCMASIDKSIEESANNLGARSIVSFLYIKVPILRHSVLSGWLLAFTLSLDDLVIASFLTGPGATTLPLLIFSNIKIGITPTINAFATLFMALVSLCIVRASWRSRKKRGDYDS
ncbi:MAG: ABC transporter permease subunit [Holosporales bacterium]|jgi:putrescine transport system permease protein|nr:ABC transporter permease subunit [Holosporales bacterium]